MTIGTGFVGRSSLGENLEPRHLVNLTRIAYSVDPAEALPSYDGMTPWRAPLQAVPPYPIASNLAPAGTPALCGLCDTRHAVGAVCRSPQNGGVGELREELRRLIVEELTTLMRG
jgi:hypothetical protein